MIEVSVKLPPFSITVTFKIKFMFELATLYIIFNMATLNTNNLSIYNKKTEPSVAYIHNWS